MEMTMTKCHLTACLVMLCGTVSLRAQGPLINPSSRPAFSPWLNLNRQGNGPTLNYFGLVRPQMNFNNSIQQLQQQTTGLQQQQQQQSTAPSELPPTGHASGFLNHSKYFLNSGGSTPSSGRVAAAPTTTQATPTTTQLTAPKKAH
jgi:hypothetical protein